VGLDPQTKAGSLTIGGNLTTGSFTMAAGAGANKVLTTNASGVATWQTPASSAPVSSVFGRTGNVTAASGDYSVGNITGAAPLASPTFTGTVTVPTPTVAGAAATKGYVDAAGGGSPYIDWNDCEFISGCYNAANTSVTLSCSTGFTAVVIECNDNYDRNNAGSNNSYAKCTISGLNSILIETGSYYSTSGYLGNQQCGSIKCCKFIVP